ncbi:MAG: hypothetical protein VXW70_04750, partial [Candidatus Thermoplasmatota archaeon]|nr:hypothetical protein [Candidatus Thermoplasmatota archaeon]
GASASDLFMILLVGWCLTLLATPSYTALQAGKNPWIFTTFIAAVVVFATILGFLLISSLANSTTNGLYGAAIASTLSSVFLLFASIHLAKLWVVIRQRSVELISTICLASITCFGFISESSLIFSGVLLFLFTPRGWRAMMTTDS